MQRHHQGAGFLSDLEINYCRHLLLWKTFLFWINMFHVTKLQQPSTGAFFEVMLHNNINQWGATFHLISVLKQSDKSSRIKNRRVCFLFFFNIRLHMRMTMFHIHYWQTEMTLLPFTWHSGKGRREHHDPLPPSQKCFRTYDLLALHILSVLPSQVSSARWCRCFHWVSSWVFLVFPED